MHFPHLHDWPTTEAEAIASSRSALAGRVDVSQPLDAFEFVAGCDIAYHLTEPILFAAVVVVRVADRSVVETRTVTSERESSRIFRAYCRSANVPHFLPRLPSYARRHQCGYG